MSRHSILTLLDDMILLRLIWAKTFADDNPNVYKAALV